MWAWLSLHHHEQQQWKRVLLFQKTKQNWQTSLWKSIHTSVYKNVTVRRQTWFGLFPKVIAEPRSVFEEEWAGRGVRGLQLRSAAADWQTDRQTLRLQGWGAQRLLVYSFCIDFFSLLTMKLDAAASDRLENICRTWDEEQSLKLLFSHRFAQWREGKKSPQFVGRRALSCRWTAEIKLKM